MPKTSTQTGAKAERLVREYLEARGFRFLYQNYRNGKYEIDLIMEDGTYLVFVEVKARTSDRYGTPAAFVTAKKQANIIAAASAFLADAPFTLSIFLLASEDCAGADDDQISLLRRRIFRSVICLIRSS